MALARRAQLAEQIAEFEAMTTGTEFLDLRESLARLGDEHGAEQGRWADLVANCHDRG